MRVQGELREEEEELERKRKKLLDIFFPYHS